MAIRSASAINSPSATPVAVITVGSYVSEISIAPIVSVLDTLIGTSIVAPLTPLVSSTYTVIAPAAYTVHAKSSTIA